MKKLIGVIALCLIVSPLFAADIDLGQFPVGKWLDHNYDAVWEFTAGSIKITDPAGAVLYDFSDKTLNDFKVVLDGGQPGITFSCTEAGRSYRFLKPLTNSDVIMEIERPDQPKYSVTMKKQ
jgi:hypothetical protein